MARIKLTYFDNPASRGEECRLALYIAGLEFEDNRIKRADWPALKPKTPFGGMPVLEVEGLGELGQSVAILTWIGRGHGLHPSDPWQAAHHEALLAAGEDLRCLMAPTLSMSDEAQKKAARAALVEGPIPRWATHVERHIAGPFVAGDALHVVDLKLYMVTKWLRSGGLDHIPATVLDPFPKLIGVQEAVAAHPKVRAWYAR